SISANRKSPAGASYAHDRHYAVPAPPSGEVPQHAACSRTTTRWRSSYLLVLTSIGNATPHGAIATKSMLPSCATAVVRRPARLRRQAGREPTELQSPLLGLRHAADDQAGPARRC